MTTSRSTITVDEAKALLVHERVLSLRDGGPDLGSVSELSEDCSEVLATYKGPLHFNRLREITPEVAQALSRHQGPLYLLQVSQISDAVAEALLQHQGAVVTFPLAEMSSGAQSLLNEHRRKICEQQGLPSRSQFAALVGTFQPVPSTANFPGEFLYYLNANTPDPIPIIVDRKTTEPTPWLADFLPKIGECIEHVYADGLPGSNPFPNAYLLSVNVSLVSGGFGCHALTLHSIDTSGTFWEACVCGERFPGEFHVDCWGGNHYGDANELARVPLTHSILFPPGGSQVVAKKPLGVLTLPEFEC